MEKNPYAMTISACNLEHFKTLAHYTDDTGNANYSPGSPAT